MKSSNNSSKKSSGKSSSGNKSGGQSGSRSGSNGSSSKSSSGSRSGASGGRGGASARSGASASRGKSGGSSDEALQTILQECLKDTYSAEKQLTKALPKMIKAANDPELKEAFENHLEQTEEQIARLEQVFEQLGFRAQGKKCAAMEGLIEEGKEVISQHENGVVRDVALIIAAQKVEHYEIAAYGSMRTLAEVMGQTEAAQLLEETLNEESDTDELLTQLASRINQEAYAEGGEEEEGEEDEEEDEEEEEDSDDVEMSDEDDEEEEETDEEDESAGKPGSRREGEASRR